MLNAKALNELLSQNRDNRLCKRWYLMTPNGTLLAYSQPTNINDLRKQAAMAAITWQEHEKQHPEGDMADGFQHEIREELGPQEPLHVLTIESESANVLVRRVQEHLVLVLEGGVPPRKTGAERRITAEGADGTHRQQPPPHESGDSTSIRSSATQGTSSSGLAANVLKLQRNKLDALAEAIIAEFKQTGFKMPEEGASTIF